MSPRELERARLAELAVEDLLHTLDGREAEEYRTLRALHPDFDPASLERAAAALHLAAGVTPEPLPEHLVARLEGGADRFFDPRGAADPAAPLPVTITTAVHPRDIGGWLAAAACVLIAVVLWPRPSAPPGGTAPARVATAASAPAASSPAASPGRATTPGPPAAPALPAAAPATAGTAASALPSAAADRAAFLRDHRPVWQRAWRAGSDPAGETVSGDVVWDPRSQEGFMRFRGLRRNNPNVEQYQLWIFDARRDQRYPVDGGVFDVLNDRAGDVVRFKSRLPVEVPLMFVVTIERRGGVVVSDRTRIAALASSG